MHYSLSADGTLLYRGWKTVLVNSEMMEQLLAESHSSPYSIHPGGMFQDLRKGFW